LCQKKELKKSKIKDSFIPDGPGRIKIKQEKVEQESAFNKPVYLGQTEGTSIRNIKIKQEIYEIGRKIDKATSVTEKLQCKKKKAKKVRTKESVVKEKTKRQVEQKRSVKVKREMDWHVSRIDEAIHSKPVSENNEHKNKRTVRKQANSGFCVIPNSNEKKRHNGQQLGAMNEIVPVINKKLKRDMEEPTNPTYKAQQQNEKKGKNGIKERAAINIWSEGLNEKCISQMSP